MKKKQLYVKVCLLTFILIFLSVTPGCNFKNLNTKNVFDEIYNEVVAVERGEDSVLVSDTESAFADYDKGAFENIQIPDLDMCLSVSESNLDILFFKGSHNIDGYTCYRYNTDTKELSGEESVVYLINNFLTHYFTWCTKADEESKYTLTDFGEYTYTYSETVNW